jgi:multiple sugar transport system ATP-binding protein
VLQQCADPRTLYERPANTFVAGGGGTPPVNLCAASVAADGRGVTVAGTTLAVGAAQVAALAGRAGGAVTIGIRPEHLAPATSGIRARVELVEPLGSETLVHWASDAGTLVSRHTDGPAPKPGETLALGARADQVLLFDPASGASLLHAEPVTAR